MKTVVEIELTSQISPRRRAIGANIGTDGDGDEGTRGPQRAGAGPSPRALLTHAV